VLKELELRLTPCTLTIKVDELRQPVTTQKFPMLNCFELATQEQPIRQGSSRNFDTKKPASHGKNWHEQSTPQAFQPESVSHRPKSKKDKSNAL